MVDLISTFAREQRHIFGVCPNPECQHLSRLANVEVSYKHAYVKDWMDKTEAQVEYWEMMKVNLEQTMNDLKKKAIDRARRTILPKRLASISPFFVKPYVKPEDIKVLLNPVDFVGFDGLITDESLRRIVFMDNKDGTVSKSVRSSIESTIDNCHYDWHVLRVGEEGKVDVE